MRTLLWAAVLGLAAGGARAGETGDVLEKVRRSIVQVSFNIVNENGSKTRRMGIGTVLDKSGLVAFSGDLMPQKIPDDKFDEFKVKLVAEADQPEVEAEFQVRDQDLATALVKVTGKLKEGLALVPVTQGNVAELKAGEPLFGFGLLPAAYQLGVNFGLGYVVKVVEKPQPLVVIGGSASIARYGPVANAKGEVVGFSVRDPLFDEGAYQRAQRDYMQGRGGDLESFQRANVVLPLTRLADLLKNPTQKRKRTWLGVADLQPLGKDIATVKGLPEDVGGVIVGRVLEGQPAAKAGLKADDVIVKLDGEATGVKDENDLKSFMERLKKLEIGQKVKVTVSRDKKEEVLEMAVGERPKDESEAARHEEKDLGLVVRELVFNDLLARDLPTDFSGLYVQYIKSGSWPELGGLREGDILTKVDDTELKGSGAETFGQLQKLVEELKGKKKKEFVLFVSRGRKGQNAAFIKVEADWK